MSESLLRYVIGVCRGRVCNQEVGLSRNHKVQLAIYFALVDGWRAGEVRRVYLYDTPKARQMVEDALHELGFAGAIAHLDPSRSDYVDLSGRECTLRCTIELYEGRLVERWTVVAHGGRQSTSAVPTAEHSVQLTAPGAHVPRTPQTPATQVGQVLVTSHEPPPPQPVRTKPATQPSTTSASSVWPRDASDPTPPKRRSVHAPLQRHESDVS